MDLRVAQRRRDAFIANPGLLQARLKREGIVDVPALEAERRLERSEELSKIVDSWPISRIADLEKRCGVPRSRVAALLGVGASAFASLASGKFTPSPLLCRRMEELERMAERGEIAGQYVSDKGEINRRIALFRAWFMAKPATVDFPLVTVAVKFKWSRSKYHEVTLPIEHLPQLRLTKWSGLVEVVRAITVAMKTLARANSRLMWKTVDQEFWERFARETLPAIVEERAKSMEARMEKARASKRA